MNKKRKEFLKYLKVRFKLKNKLSLAKMEKFVEIFNQRKNKDFALICEKIKKDGYEMTKFFCSLKDNKKYYDILEYLKMVTNIYKIENNIKEF